MTPEQFRDLLQKYYRQEMTAPELEAFIEAAGDPASQPLLEEALMTGLREGSFPVVSDKARMEDVYRRFLENSREKAKRQRRPVLVRLFTWKAAAAILVAAITTTVYYRLHHQAADAAVSVAASSAIVELPPGSDKATLTLSNGAVISLDSTGRKELAQQGNIRLLQLDSGRISYQPQTGQTAAISYNTITTPYGGQYRIILADGTQVWLNAASSLKYPTSFTGHNREVQLTGEAYFEVAARPGQPFFVQMDKDTRVAVLGTHFNISAYSDEKDQRITLTEGSIRVGAGRESRILTPGQQANIIDAAPGMERMKVAGQIDLGQVLAWKDGMFDFRDIPFDKVMNQLSRWYNIEVVYENGVPDVKFEGQLGRDVNLSRVLSFFGKIGLHYHMEGNRKLVIEK
jgi:ferric-dicitrate binding protein FerR (iron transport regulator)